MEEMVSTEQLRIRISTLESERMEQLLKLFEQSQCLSSKFILTALIEKMEKEIHKGGFVQYSAEDDRMAFDAANILWANWNGYFD